MSTLVDASVDWGEWFPLDSAGSNREIPSSAGLYRIRVRGEQASAYIGQTGRSLRSRLGMLKGAYGDVMPYADPHTAAPALWAFRDRDACEFECSAALFGGDHRDRLAHECVEISRHREQFQASPAVNFGGMPDGYLKSSGNNQKLVDAGKRFRGGRDPYRRLVPSIAPTGSLQGTPESAEWMGLQWSRWRSWDHDFGSGSMGIYRLRKVGGSVPVYVGQGRLVDRIRAHVKKGSIEGHAQQLAFSWQLEASVVELPLLKMRNLLEIENDLIASFTITHGEPPDAQFLG